MPILEKDPWRMQYFQGAACPDDVVVPTDDEYAYKLYPEHHWIYNKLVICESQGIECGPHGLPPPRFPVFSKPIFNLRGMGVGGRVIQSLEDYELHHTPGHMWMPMLEGEHVSTDVAVVGGEPAWWRHTTAKPLGDGMFDYWTVEAESRTAVEEYCGDWLRRHLKGYYGLVNFETIGGRIIEAHLRFADQWPDLYGTGWLDSVIELYHHKRWRFADSARKTGYSVVLFGGHGLHYPRVDRAAVAAILQHPDVSSVQITFHEDKPPEMHAMPPGGFRLAIVNCWDLAAGLEARQKLALMFWSTQTLREAPPKRIA